MTLEELRDEYVASLPAKADAIRVSALVTSTVDGPNNAAADLAAQLKSSAGLFGFLQVGKLAGTIEALLLAGSRSAELMGPLDALDVLCRVALRQKAPHSPSPAEPSYR